jgi:hypothetical protein
MVIKQRAALKAIHRLLIQGRIMSYDGINNREFKGEDLFTFFDHIEYLPTLLLETEDRSRVFGEYLEGICQEYNCPFIFVEYTSSSVS